METHVLALASRLTRLNPFVLCVDADEMYAQRLKDAGIGHGNLAVPRIDAWRATSLVRRLLAVPNGIRAHVVHSYGFSADLVAALVKLLSPRCVLITSRRGIDTSVRHQRVRSLINRVTNQVICVSDETADYVRRTERLSPNRLRVIPNGVVTDPARATGSRCAEVVFGTLGNVKPIKGTDLLIEAFCALPGDAPVRLRIGGTQGIRDRDKKWGQALVERVHASPRGTAIEFAGFQHDPREFLRTLDVFVLPSRSEGMSNALLEAMSLGLPCIATDVGSNASVLRPLTEEPAGMVCEPTVDSLRDAMWHMFSSPEDRARSGAAARRAAVARYSFETMVSRYEDTYAELLHR
jgi:glycosyltransferase involved in cell wall biosynthesis